MLAAIRSGEINLPLFFHVLGAALWVGTMLTVVVTTYVARRRGEAGAGLRRLAFRTVLLGAFPAFLVARVAAQITAAQYDFPDDGGPLWLDIGYGLSDIGGLLVLISMILSAIGLRKLRRGGGQRLSTAVGIISAIVLVALVVAAWAMTAKPV